MGSPSPLGALKLWQRVPVRLTLIYGIALVLVLTPAAWVVYGLAVQSELDNLWSRIRMTTVALSELIEAERLVTIDRADHPYRAELQQHFGAIIATAPEFASIYVFTATDDPNTMRFVVDVDVRRAPGAYGETYDASDYKEMRDGFAGPTLETEPVADDWGVSVSGFAPIRDASGKAVALLGVDVDAARIERMKEALLIVAVGAYLGALLLLALAALGVARMLRTPLMRMIRGTGKIAEGDLEVRVGELGKNEFGVLGHHFDQMARGLGERERIRQVFGRYVSEEVAKKLLAEGGDRARRGEQREVTILFSDLRGYSTLSERLTPPQVLELMNEYLELMNQVIAAHGGCIIEYTGDGVLAVFGAPDDLPNHPERAVRAAFAMRDSLAALNLRWEHDGTAQLWKGHGLDAIDSIKARIGLHTGPVVAGSLGSNLRMKYTILGDSVNIASRLEGKNKELGTDILASEAVVSRLPADLKQRAKSEGAHTVKGRQQPVALYSF